MKKLIAITSIAILGSTTAAWAHDQHFGGNEDMYQSALLDHGKGAPTGQSQKGEGDLYGSHMANPEDVATNPNVKRKQLKPSDLDDQDPEGYGLNQ
ncbi:hypothetical protein [Thiolapillus brandeum]|uniref:Uncharacterized protein n=1 Tax=Thiolapillus brandeum TaxID=1076588 RepID=A0A7U6GIR9_9GAMM|nr:hypothetical protein [Thiolapillus brandeum]BAO44372.1 conserved hypothetical protein [Thiolapillus brandeum]